MGEVKTMLYTRKAWIVRPPGAAFRLGRALALPIFEFLSSTHPVCLHSIFERLVRNLLIHLNHLVYLLPRVWAMLKEILRMSWAGLSAGLSGAVASLSMGDFDLFRPLEPNEWPSGLQWQISSCLRRIGAALPAGYDAFSRNCQGVWNFVESMVKVDLSVLVEKRVSYRYYIVL